MTKVVYRGQRVSPAHRWGPELTVEKEGCQVRAYHCFEWGYGGTGPGELAQFILREHLEGQGVPRKQWMAFKFEVIAELPRDVPWSFTSDDVQAWLDSGIVPRVFPKLGNTEGIGHGTIRLRTKEGCFT